MKAHVASSLLVLGMVATACGGDSENAEPIDSVPISGMYEVTGETVSVETGDKRQISGKIIIAADASRQGYTATFNLNTTYPGAEEALPAEVIGKGEGAIDGRSLTGTAQTQLVMATVPGVDPGFAFVPRMVSTRIVSSSEATVADDGTVQVQIENQAAPGQRYTPTRTTLSGYRVSSGDVLEGVAARD